jgi:hypothetical protein
MQRLRLNASRSFVAGLETPVRNAYDLPMDDYPHPDPADWLEVLIESEADIAAGRIVSGASVMRDLYASLARLEAKASSDPQPMAPAQR